MTAGRQDAWTAEEDRLLAELVLNHIRKGSTQLKAFKEAGEKLARTAAACGFRWNSFVRKNYGEEISHAKKERKHMQASLNLEEHDSSGIDPKEGKQDHPLDKAVNLILLYKSKGESEKEDAIRENVELKSRVDSLCQQLEKANEQYEALKAEYSSLLHILDKARKLAKKEEV